MDGLNTDILGKSILLPLVSSFVGTALLLIVSSKFSIYARQDHRRKQTKSIPLLGGVAINLSLLIFLSFQSLHFHNFNFNFILGAFALSLFLGVIDDIYELNSINKFLVQNFIAIILIYATRNHVTPIQQFITDNTYIAYSLQWFWIMGLLNSINLIDGLDGLASGIGMIVLSFLTLQFYSQTGFYDPFSIAAIFAIAGFYLFNKHPAKIYLGEVGTTTIAIMIYLSSIKLSTNSSSFISIAAPILAVGIPALDTLVAIIRRSRRRMSLATADREHIHHRLLRLGFSHQTVVQIIYGLTIYLCLLSYSLFPEGKFYLLNAVLGVIGIVIAIFLTVLAERKLYTYLKNFGNQMLQVMDTQNYGRMTSYIRMENLHDQQIKFQAFRVNLDLTVQNLLADSPGRIRTFYTEIASYLRTNILNSELYFESSTMLVVIHKSSHNDPKKLSKNDLLQELKTLESEISLSLYLDRQKTLEEIYFNPHEAFQINNKLYTSSSTHKTHSHKALSKES